MFRLTIKRYLRQFKDDPRSVIEDIYCYDNQIGYWLANPKTFSYELLKWVHI